MQVSKILGGSGKAEGLADGCSYARPAIGKLALAAATRQTVSRGAARRTSEAKTDYNEGGNRAVDEWLAMVAWPGFSMKLHPSGRVDFLRDCRYSDGLGASSDHGW